MASKTYSAIYLGNLADMDGIETDQITNNPGTVLAGNSYGSAGQPLHADALRVTLTDSDKSTRAEEAQERENCALQLKGLLRSPNTHLLAPEASRHPQRNQQ